MRTGTRGGHGRAGGVISALPQGVLLVSSIATDNTLSGFGFGFCGCGGFW